MLYLTGLLVPFSLAMLLKHRDFTRFFALVALTLLLFGLSSQKSYAFIPVFVFLFYYCLRSRLGASARSEEHTSELQSLMRISYAVFCLKKKKKKQTRTINK